MGLIGNLFRKAQDLDFQDRRIVLLEGEVQHLRNKLELTEKAVETARQSENKTLRRVADVGLQQMGRTPLFTKDAEPKKEPQRDTTEDERIRDIAKMQLDADVERGLEPLPIEDYIRMVRDEGAESIILN